MTNFKKGFYGLVMLLAGILGWVLLRHHDKHIDKSITSTMLPPQDKEELIVNSHTHIITEVSRNAKGKTSVKKVFEGPTTKVEYENNGNIKVTTRNFGTELSPSIGILYGSDTTLRAAGTLGLLYYQRYEFGVGLAVGSHIQSGRALISVTSNVYDNILLGVFLDNHKDAGVIATLRF